MVAGAGNLGSKIAWQIAFSGFNVSVYDPYEESLSRSRAEHLEYAKVFHEWFNCSTQSIEDSVNRLSYSTSLESALENADLISESIPERFEIKSEFYKACDRFAPSHTIFTTNTSGGLPSDYARLCGRPEKMLALHFCAGVWQANLTEVMGHAGTSKSIIDAVVKFSRDIDMKPIVINKEHAGHVLNNLLPMVSEYALNMHLDGAAEIEDIDRAWMLGTSNIIGPFGIMDVVGMNMNYIAFSADPENIQNARAASFFKENFIDKGHLGASTGQGFYSYPEPSYNMPNFLKSPLAPNSSPLQKIGVLCEKHENDNLLNLLAKSDLEVHFLHAQSSSNDIVDLHVVIDLSPEKTICDPQRIRDIRKLNRECILVIKSDFISPSEYQDTLNFSDQVFAMNVSNCGEGKALCELMRCDGLESNSKKYQGMAAQLTLFFSYIGITTTVVIKNEKYGFILNQLMFPMLMAAIDLWFNDISTLEDIDRVWMISCSAPIGPFGLIDRVGIDHLYDAFIYWGTESKNQDLLDKGEFLKARYLDQGKYGACSGEGFYRYPSPIYEAEKFVEP